MPENDDISPYPLHVPAVQKVICDDRLSSQNATRLALLTTVLVIGGSQWGMVLLSFVYAQIGRVSLAVTPELLFGSAAIFLVIILSAWHKNRVLVVRGGWKVLLPLCAFVLVCSISECFQNYINWRSIISIATLLIYVVVGAYCGHHLAGRRMLTALWVILSAFLLWHVGLGLLGLSGLLSFEKILVGAALPRLETTGGFSATELPIITGMQLPFVLMVIFSSIRGSLRLIAYILLAANIVLLAFTASVGAIIATALVFVMLVANSSRVVKIKSLFLLVLGTLFLVGMGGLYFAELYLSVAAKIDDIAVGGGRAKIYSFLVATALDHPWIGIGKSNFQYINNFRWDGTGVYPHNNILGIAAELGIAAAVLYSIFVVACLKYLLGSARRMKQLGYDLRSSLLVASAAVVIYQQARGMLHDTWMIKELYFWIGFGVGVVSIPRRFSIIRGATKPVASGR